MNKNHNERGLKTGNIYSLLFAKTLIAFGVLMIAQLFFILANLRILHVETFGEWMGILWGNILYCMATVGVCFAPYFLLNLIPFNFRWNRHYRNLVELLLYIMPLIAIILMNFSDAVYYQFTFRRLSGDTFRYMGISGNLASLTPYFLTNFWYATLTGVVLMIVSVLLSCHIRLMPRNKYNNHTTNDIVGFVIGCLLVLFMATGGLGKPLRWDGAYRYCQPKFTPLVVNSTYSMLGTFMGGTLEPVHYMDDDRARSLFDPLFVADTSSFAATSTGWKAGMGHWMVSSTDSLGNSTQPYRTRYSNVVIIVLESFSQEYMGCYNPHCKVSRTPFLDSLAKHSIVYQGRANGKKSIEGIPSVFASLPTLMTFPLTLSDYANNRLHGLPAVLDGYGYHTAFFHGSYEGVMSFDKICRQMGFEEYYGMDEYITDRTSKDSDFDGYWGIFDEPFLQYMVHRMSTFPEPFMAGVFTLSSHNPYVMQPDHKGDFSEGQHPILRVVSYSDNALRQFFNSARQCDWYRNTLFVITADHPGPGLSREYNDYDGWYRIPMMFYLPRYEEGLAPSSADPVHTAQFSPRIMQQLDIMPTVLDYLGVESPAVCFGTSAFRNPDGWQISYGNGYYQLEDSHGIALLCRGETRGNGNADLLKAVVQQYNRRMIDNALAPPKTK